MFSYANAMELAKLINEILKTLGSKRPMELKNIYYSDATKLWHKSEFRG